jgi:hypothetical protein
MMRIPHEKVGRKKARGYEVLHREMWGKDGLMEVP